MSLYDEIRDYLRTDSEGISTFFNGQSLCLQTAMTGMGRKGIVALLCWYMMVAKEVSQALALHRGIVAIETGPNQIELRENPFTQILGAATSWISHPKLRERLELEYQIASGNPNCEDLAVNQTMLNYLRDGLGDWSINSFWSAGVEWVGGYMDKFTPISTSQSRREARLRELQAQIGCQDAIPHCRSVTTLPEWGLDGGKGFVARLLCSETCGCADPGGEWFGDLLRNFTPWVSWVDQLRHFANVTGPEHYNRMHAQVLADLMWDYGCDFKEHTTDADMVWGDCYEWEPLFEWGFKTLAFFCPITCGCAEKTLPEQENRRDPAQPHMAFDMLGSFLAGLPKTQVSSTRIDSRYDF
eukprot:Skav213802  [mRNA]  locus=scaffold1987:335296:344303:- [translate_table: standard]